ncbi:MAG: hypothetical protein AAFY59_16855, partial [Pseudomonadota bacterium]
FRLRPTATEADLQNALDKAQLWISRQEGFEYSTVSVDYKDITHLVFWASKAHAEAAQEAFPKAPENGDLMAVIDPDTMEMGDHPIIHAFGPAARAEAAVA